jgi:hypothetical protein
LIPWFNFDWHPASDFNYFYNRIHLFDDYKYNYSSIFQIYKNQNLPSSFDWRNVNGVDYMTRVKNQNPAPTCEAYALCASIETIIQYQIGYPFNCDLSEAHLFFYSGGTCDWGVDIQETVEYLLDYGVPDEGCFPDPHRPFDFPFESISGWEERAIKIKEWGWVNNDVESIKNALLEFGPLVICQMTRRDLDYYDAGIYMPKINSHIQRGHVVTIVGYDDNDGCWTIRNSGGTNWGEDGYFRVSYDAFDPFYSFIYPFYGGTGILYIDGIYGNLKPDVPKIEIEIPKLYHTYIFDNEINTIFKRVSDIQRAAPRIFGDLTVKVNTSNANKVEFLFDGDIQYIDENEPYLWIFDSSNGLHTIEVIAYNDKYFSKDIIDVFVL